jgi:hypothetical protein
MAPLLNLDGTNTHDHSRAFYALNDRYAEGYNVANGLVHFGRGTKWVSLALGAVFAVVGLYYMSDGGTRERISGIMCAGAGIVTAASGFVAGVVIAALGQMMLCAADTAVNTSPLLSHAQKADIIGVPQLETD